jgi:hypothetical protein
MAENSFDPQQLISALKDNPDILSKLKSLTGSDENAASGIAGIAKDAGLNLDVSQVSGLLENFGGLEGLLSKLNIEGVDQSDGFGLDDIKGAVSNVLGK